VHELRLDAAAEAQWLSVLNDARLALGTRLGVTDDPDGRRVGSDDAEQYAFQVYDWLTHLQGELVEVLLAGLPDAGADDDDPAPPER
jgi:hypothetical protein